MQPDRRFWAGKRVCVTGGSGFLGWHLIQELLPLTSHVRVLGLPPVSPVMRSRLTALEFISGDVRDPAIVRRAVRDCDVIFHAAGPTTTWGHGLKDLREIHVAGTSRVLEALPAGSRMVHTSSVTAVGASLHPTLLTEDSPFHLHKLPVDYVHAKRAAEGLALSAGSRGIHVTVVNPAYLIGPDDFNYSTMGRFCRRCWKNRVPVVPRGGFNCVDVRDVARGHLLAAERGQAGRRYILGGENQSLLELVRQLAEVTGRRARWLCRVPPWLHAALAWCSQINAADKKRGPHSTVQESRVASLYWFFSHERARTELGYQPRPLQETLHDTFDWACQYSRLKRGSERGPDRPHQSAPLAA